MLKIFKGETTTITVKTANMEYVEKIIYSINNDKIKKTYPDEDVYDEDDQTITFNLTQDDTLLLVVGENKLQAQYIYQSQRVDFSNINKFMAYSAVNVTEVKEAN